MTNPEWRPKVPAAAAPRQPWEVLREAADIIALESGHTKGGAAFDFLTFEAARLEAAAAPKPPTLAEAVRAYDQDPGAKWSDVMEALARAEKTPAKNVPEEDQRENIYRHPEGWIDGDFE